MRLGYVGACVEVGYCAGHLEDAVVGAGGESPFVDGGFEHGQGGIVEAAVFAYRPGGHLGVGVDVFPVETVHLDVAGPGNPFADGGGGFFGAVAGELPDVDGRDLYVNVYPVEKGAGYAGPVLVDLGGRAGAGAFRVAEVAAGTGVHGRDEHEPGGEGDGVVHAGDCDLAVFQGLTQGVENVAVELGELIEEQVSLINVSIPLRVVAVV